jgi:hypothetical protein
MASLNCAAMSIAQYRDQRAIVMRKRVLLRQLEPEQRSKYAVISGMIVVEKSSSKNTLIRESHKKSLPKKAIDICATRSEAV